MCVKTMKCQAVSPFLLVEIKQHLLLKFILSVINSYGIIMPVQSMDQCLKKTNIDRSEVVKTEYKITASKTINGKKKEKGL